jgi:hypothetical protein
LGAGAPGPGSPPGRYRLTQLGSTPSKLSAYPDRRSAAQAGSGLLGLDRRRRCLGAAWRVWRSGPEARREIAPCGPHEHKKCPIEAAFAAAFVALLYRVTSAFLALFYAFCHRFIVASSIFSGYFLHIFLWQHRLFLALFRASFTANTGETSKSTPSGRCRELSTLSRPSGIPKADLQRTPIALPPWSTPAGSGPPLPLPGSLAPNPRSGVFGLFNDFVS